MSFVDSVLCSGFAIIARDTHFNYEKGKNEAPGIKAFPGCDDTVIKFVEDFCKPFITSLDGRENQAVNCIKADSRLSDSVKTKEYGVEIRNGSLCQFTDEIEINNITFKYSRLW